MQAASCLFAKLPAMFTMQSCGLRSCSRLLSTLICAPPDLAAISLTMPVAHKIYEFNRIIRDLNGYEAADFLEKLSEHFIIKPKEQELWKPQSKFEFGMYLDGKFYALFYKQSSNVSSSAVENILNNLDAQILYDKVLQPLLGIEDLRNDERIEYIPGKQSIATIKELVDEGEFAVGFMLFPSDISEIKALADNNLIMPPKSTYIEPKFRSGLMVYEL